MSIQLQLMTVHDNNHQAAIPSPLRPLGQGPMKDIMVSAMLIAVGIFGLTHVDGIQRLYDEAYPQSVEKSQALDRCAAANSGFDRLDAAERANCYARLRAPSPGLIIGSQRESRLQSTTR